MMTIFSSPLGGPGLARKDKDAEGFLDGVPPVTIDLPTWEDSTLERPEKEAAKLDEEVRVSLEITQETILYYSITNWLRWWMSPNETQPDQLTAAAREPAPEPGGGVLLGQRTPNFTLAPQCAIRKNECTLLILLGYRGFFSRVFPAEKSLKCLGCYNFPGT